MTERPAPNAPQTDRAPVPSMPSPANTDAAPRELGHCLADMRTALIRYAIASKAGRR